MAVLSREELVTGHILLLGIDLQRSCGLWDGNAALFQDCRIWASANLIDSKWEPASLYESLHLDEVARTILEALWDALHGWPVTEAIKSASLWETAM